METPLEPPSARQRSLYRSAWGFYLVVAVTGVVWLGAQSGDLSLALFINLDAWWIDLGIGVAAGGALIVTWWTGRRWLAGMRELEGHMRVMIGRLDGSEIFALALISGFSEELLFRGAMQSSWGWPWALAVFALLHTGPGPSFRYWTVFALLAGAVFAWITLLRGTLMPAMVAHVLVNGVNLARLVAGIDDIDDPEPAVNPND